VVRPEKATPATSRPPRETGTRAPASGRAITALTPFSVIGTVAVGVAPGAVASAGMR
jgi:hypothetical protein